MALIQWPHVFGGIARQLLSQRIFSEIYWLLKILATLKNLLSKSLFGRTHIYVNLCVFKWIEIK